MRIGIDVGGTNTDAVLIDGNDVLAEVKTPTTPDVTTGMLAALAHSSSPRARCRERRAVGDDRDDALHERGRRGAAAAPTGVIRLGLPATEALPPMVGWPARSA